MPILGKCFYFSATQYCQLAVSEPGLPRLEVQQEPGSLQPVNPSSIRTTCRHITGVWGGSLPGISDSEGLGRTRVCITNTNPGTTAVNH